VRAGAAAGAAYVGADAGEQLARREWLDHVVVGAALQPLDAVILVGAGGEHDHRHVVAGTQRAADGKAVLPGQHHVEEDQIDAGARRLLEAALAVGDPGHVHAVVLEETGRDLGERAVVLDEEDVDAIITRNFEHSRRAL
jgi:hypothetical protein